jgi:transcriptional regulator with XRE-family HTH domain
MTSALAYGEILGRNVSAARGRLQLSQAAVAQRMRVLGFAWQQQTAAAVEKNRRRATAEEILGLALALETTIPALMSAREQDEDVELPSGQPIGAVSVERLAGRGINDRAIRWPSGDKQTGYSVTIFRRLKGVDAFDATYLSQPAWTEEPDEFHPGPSTDQG